MNAFFKKHFGSRSVRAGGYAAVASAIVVAIAIAVNLLVSALPETVTHPDFTENQLYTLSDQTKRITNALEKDVTLSLIASSGNENTTILSLLKRYEGASAHITVETVDPVLYPNFARQYTSGTVRSNSVVVTCEGRSRYVDYSDIFKQVKSDNYDTYYYYVQMGYSQYYDYLYDTVFDGENALTAAINYVSSDSLTKIYTLSGHSEAELSETFTEAIKADNFEFESLHLMDVEAVPEDAGLILINAPASDLSEDEAALLIGYLDAGGNVLLTTDCMESDSMKNLLSVCEHMGMTLTDGMVVETSQNRYYRNPVYLLPEIGETEITQAIRDGGYYILFPIAQGIVSAGDGFSYTPLLSTSDSAFSKKSGYGMTTYDKEEGDTDGPFDVAAATSKGEAHMVWFASAQFATDNVNAMVSGANADLLVNAINWMAQQEDKISIRSKSLETGYLTVSAADSRRWSILLVGVIPAALIAVGAVVIIRRKRK